jgi:hypothetical protein
VKYPFRDGKTTAIKCKHCRYNNVLVTRKRENCVYVFCGRCGKVTKCIIGDNSLKRVEIEREPESEWKYENDDRDYRTYGIVEHFFDIGSGVIFVAIVIFFAWQPFLNLLPTFVFHINDYPNLFIVPTCLYLLWVVLFYLINIKPLSLLFLVLLVLQFSDIYNRDAIFEFIENQNYLLNGSITLAIGCMLLLFFSKINKLAKALLLGGIGCMAMYTLYKSALPIFVDMDYTYTFANHLIRYICVSVMFLPMLLALLYIASNLGSLKKITSILFPIGVIYMCELLPIPYTESLYIHIPIVIVYLYSSFKIGKFIYIWLKSGISLFEIENLLSFGEIWTPKVRMIAKYVVCSSVLLFVISSVLMIFVR